jgi:iron-sulfur cluster assembly accessory protein
MIKLTQKAKTKLIERGVEYVRVGVTGGGCAGYEYVFKDAIFPEKDDTVIDYDRFYLVIDELSLPFLENATLDYVTEGLNEMFKFINPSEKSSCGCGVSIQFDLNKVNPNKIQAIEL